MIGDKATDVELARALGCRALLVLTGKGRDESARIASGTPRARDVLEAVESLLLPQPRV